MTDYRKPRFRTSQPGIASLHCFSSGPHYDPDNLSFGPILGLDEHLLEPGAGFDWHAHRGVHIVSWVLDGTLRHEDSDGVVRFVERGPLLVQSTGTGIRHTETNPSTTEPLRFVQLTILGENDPGVRSTAPPATVGGVDIDVRADVADAGAGRRRTVYAPEGVGRLLVLEVGT